MVVFAVATAAVAAATAPSLARTQSLRLETTATANYPTAYDILVRPQGTRSHLERTRGLVRNNFLSGLHGGITLDQYERIRRIRAVAVAAPVANIEASGIRSDEQVIQCMAFGWEKPVLMRMPLAAQAQCPVCGGASVAAA